MFKLLGTFENESGKMMVSDPCYEVGTWCQHEMSNVKKGTWEAYSVTSDEGSWGIRVSELVAIHKQSNPSMLQDWQHESSSIGVDSGQAGIFDFDKFRNDDSIEGVTSAGLIREVEPGDKWYNVCCDLTLSAAQAGILNGGVISSSGYGDGSYDCYVQKNADGEVIAVKVVFIGAYEEDEDYDEDDECSYCENDPCTCEYCGNCDEHVEDCTCEEA